MHNILAAAMGRRNTPMRAPPNFVAMFLHTGLMEQATSTPSVTPVPTRQCPEGHQMTPFSQGPNRAPRWKCRECEQIKRKHPDALSKAARRRAEQRAKFKAQQPERYQAHLKAVRDRRAKRAETLTPGQQAKQDLLKSASWVRKNEKEKAARALGVSIAVYTFIQAESEMSEDEIVKDSNRPSAPWNLLKVKPDALPAWNEFSTLLETTVTPCQGSTKYTEYDDPRPGREDENTGVAMPTRGEARRMCQACPLYDACQEFAAKDKPDFGIYAGERFVGGKKI